MANPEKDFQKDLDAIRADISALSETLGNFVAVAGKAQGEMGKAAHKAAKGAASNASDFLEEGAQLGRDSAQAAADGMGAGVVNLEDQIKRNPMNAVMIALGVGFLVGVIGHK